MRILVVNPNTNVEMTKQVERALNRIKRDDTILDVTNPSFGPLGVASSYDEIVAGVELVKIVRARGKGYDAIVIACFSDPGIIAAKELCDCPVVGMAEASVHMACLLGDKFTILTTANRRVPSKALYVRCSGLESRLASVRAVGVRVEETTGDEGKTKAAVLVEAKKAIEEDGAEVIILGCAGMAGYDKELEEALGVPVLDPNAVALKMAEAMVDLGLKPSKIGLFAHPPTLCL